MKKVLITGITGQDGLFLSRHLLESNPKTEIFGTSRNKNNRNFYKKLQILNVKNSENIKLTKVNLLDSQSVNNLIKDIAPDAVYNLTGPSSVYESISNPKIAVEIEEIFQNLVNSLLVENNFCKFFQSSSSEMFGPSNYKLNEDSYLSPNSPYSLAKSVNHYKVSELKEKYDWEIFSGIMFNHESEFRTNNYLIMKIVEGALSIKDKSADLLTIGSLDIVRDWSYAGDVVEAIQAIMLEGKDFSYNIAFGKSYRIKNIIEFVFSYLELNWENYVNVDSSLLRDGDFIHREADISKILNHTNWTPKTSLEELLEKILKFKISY